MAIFSDIHSNSFPTFSTGSTHVTATSSTAADTLGAWAEVINSSTQEADRVLITSSPNGSADVLVKFGVGAASSESTEFQYNVLQEVSPGPHGHTVPWSVPSGSRCAVAIANTETTAQVTSKVGVTLLGP